MGMFEMFNRIGTIHAKLLLCGILIFAAVISIAAGAAYSHKYDTFEISFLTPYQTFADVQWGDEKPGMTIKVNLGDGIIPYITPHALTTWESRATTKSNLERLWTSRASGNAYTSPTIKELANGDFLASGRMMIQANKITTTMRTFDFDGDDRIDYIVFWNGHGNFDYNILNSMASNTHVSLLDSKSMSSSDYSASSGTTRQHSRSAGRAFGGG